MKKYLLFLLLFITFPLSAQETFNKLNLFSDKLLEEKIKVNIKTLSPVVFSSPNRFLALYRNGQVDKQDVLPPPASWLKELNHVSLALFALLYPFDETQVNGQKLQELTTIITAAQKQLSKLDFTPDQRERQQIILAKSKAILEQTSKKGKLSSDQYQRFFAELRPLINANTEDAVFYEFNLTCKIMAKWRQQLGDKEWEKLTVVVLGDQILHTNGTNAQFFAKLLNTKPGYGRLIVLDNVTDIKTALDALSLIRISVPLGQVVLGDPNSVLQDVYAPFWDNYLAKTKITTQGCSAKQ